MKEVWWWTSSAFSVKAHAGHRGESVGRWFLSTQDDGRSPSHCPCLCTASADDRNRVLQGAERVWTQRYPLARPEQKSPTRTTKERAAPENLQASGERPPPHTPPPPPRAAVLASAPGTLHPGTSLPLRPELQISNYMWGLGARGAAATLKGQATCLKPPIPTG